MIISIPANTIRALSHHINKKYSKPYLIVDGIENFLATTTGKTLAHIKYELNFEEKYQVYLPKIPKTASTVIIDTENQTVTLVDKKKTEIVHKVRIVKLGDNQLAQVILRYVECDVEPIDIVKLDSKLLDLVCKSASEINGTLLLKGKTLDTGIKFVSGGLTLILMAMDIEDDDRG